jgi:hypothetical protein
MFNYVTKNNEDLFSIVNKTVGDLNNVYVFLKDNQYVTISNVPALLNTKFERVVSTPQIVKPIVNNLSNELFYESRNSQNIYDICLMTTCDLNNIYNLIKNFEFNSINNALNPGIIFNFNKKSIKDNIIKKYILDKKVIFNTGERQVKLRRLIWDGHYIIWDGINKLSY